MIGSTAPYRETVLTVCAAENSRLATKAAPVTTLTPGIIIAAVSNAILPAFIPETFAAFHLNWLRLISPWQYRFQRFQTTIAIDAAESAGK